MTNPFSYLRATTRDEAARHLAEPGAVALGGGTDLLVSIAEEIVRAETLIDLRRMPNGEGGRITELADGGLRIDASVSIAEIARNALVRDRYGVLAKACGTVGTPALRNSGTLGGNLCQRPRCWYYRRGVACLKRGGNSCPAVAGENQYLAVVEGGPCFAVHPSDPAVALAATDAVVEIASMSGDRRVTMSEFYRLPSERVDRETVLEHGEFVSAVLLPAEAAGGTQFYHKLMQRDAWDFALVSVAGCKRPNGDVRIVMGGVSPRPWRVNTSIEEDVSSGGLDDDVIETLAERALYDARPLSQNGYKIEMAASLLRQVMREIA